MVGKYNAHAATNAIRQFTNYPCFRGGHTFEFFRERQHDEKINEDAKCETGKFGLLY
jgi:hypothetical protein